MTHNDVVGPFIECIANDLNVIFLTFGGALPQSCSPDLDSHLENLFRGLQLDMNQACLAIGQPATPLYKKSGSEIMVDIFQAGSLKFFLLAAAGLARILLQTARPALLAAQLNVVAIARKENMLYLAEIGDGKTCIRCLQTNVWENNPASEIKRNKEFKNLAESLANFDFGDLITKAPIGLWLRDPLEAAILALKNSGKCNIQDYKKRNPEIVSPGLDPIRHYIMHGIHEGRQMPLKGSNSIPM